jgi:DNA-binding response OmpR family regulator
MGRKILLVDDDVEFRGLVRIVLHEPGTRIFEAATCAEAMEFARQIDFDVVLLDNVLPDGYGVDLIAELREYCPRVFMLTADEPVIRERALSSGAEEVFPKTVDICDLADYVRA